MKGDYTRFTWKPEKRYESVRMQQGRVQVDADWNEQMDILAHLRETALGDVIGHCCAPSGDAGFEIGVTGGNLSISEGRMYVDGILCEQMDPALTYLEQPDYPDAPLPDAAGRQVVYLDVWKRHVTALEDAEIREVALGGPDTATRLQTVSQVKLCAVEVTDETSGGCDADFPEWDQETARPSGRLAARAQPVDDPDDPCIVPSTAGYSRLEHQLYRVEVHEGGDLGNATFKWSRDNGTVVTDWLEQDGNELTVRSTGRDRLLSFHQAHWVELIDDARELRGEAGLLVEVVDVRENVIEIDPGGQTVDLAGFGPHPKVRRWDMDTDDGAMPIEVPATNDGWIPLESGVEIHFDQGSYRTGDYWVIPARAFVGEFAGDIEWPRDETTDDPLSQAPHGIEHHYCRLAVVDFDGETFSGLVDCRHTFPGLCGLEDGEGEPDADECCCTVVVRPGESVQAALNALPRDVGGCVCLKPGTHAIRRPLLIRGSNVILKGESAGARLVRTGGVEVIRVEAIDGVRLSRVHVEGLGIAAMESDQEPSVVGDTIAAVREKSGFLVWVDRCDDFQLRSCSATVGAEPEFPGLPAVMAGGALLARCANPRIEGCSFSLLNMGIVAPMTDSAEIAGCAFEGPAPREGFERFGAAVAVWIGLMGGYAHRIVGNRIHHYNTGVRLGNRLGGQAIFVPKGAQPPPEGRAFGGEWTVIARNEVLRRNPETNAETYNYGIDIGAAHCQIRDNAVLLPNRGFAGIRLTAPHGDVHGNRLVAGKGVSSERPRSVGIVLGSWNGEAPDAVVDGSRVHGNHLIGSLHGVVVWASEEGDVDDVRVEGNRISGEAREESLLAISLGRCRRTSVAGNSIDGVANGVLLLGGGGNRILGNRLRRGAYGIQALLEEGLEVADNVIEEMARAGLTAGWGTGLTSIADCRFLRCGWKPLNDKGAMTIVVLGRGGEVAIEACRVLETGSSPTGESAATAAFGIWVDGVESCRIGNCLVASRDPRRVAAALEDRAVFVSGALALVLRRSDRSDFPNDAVAQGALQVADNQFVGPGVTHLVEIGVPHLVEIGRRLGGQDTFSYGLSFEKGVFANNHCRHLVGEASASAVDQGEAATLAFWVPHLVLQGNQVKAQQNGAPYIPMNAANLRSIGVHTVLGNMMTGKLAKLGHVIPNNFADFNALP